jgi:hypothetical protein
VIGLKKEDVIMQNAIEDIRQGLYEIRHLLGPIDAKLGHLEHKITTDRVSSGGKLSELEAKIAVNALRISEQAAKSQENSSQIASLFEHLKWIENCLNVSKRGKEKPDGCD